MQKHTLEVLWHHFLNVITILICAYSLKHLVEYVLMEMIKQELMQLNKDVAKFKVLKMNVTLWQVNTKMQVVFGNIDCVIDIVQQVQWLLVLIDFVLKN